MLKYSGRIEGALKVMPKRLRLKSETTKMK